jgi:alkylation response protein AidB-like acyl-CoA dehydrogenase
MKDGGTKVEAAVRDLLGTIAARSGEIEAARRLPVDLLDQLKAAGCFRMFVPRSHGGEEVSLRTGLDVLEALARADGATGWTVMIGSESPHLFALLPRARFDAIYAAGPDVVLGGAFNPQGEAQAAEGGYRVTGRWGFASGCEHCDWLFANCVVTQDGSPRPGPEPGVPETRAMLLAPKDTRILDTWSVLGLRGTGSHDIAVEGLFVAAEDSFDIFMGRSTVPSPNFVVPALHAAIHMGAVALGIAQGALDDLLAIVKAGKRRLYARAPLVDSPVFHNRLGRAVTTLQTARGALHALSDRFWGACTGAPEGAFAFAPETTATLAWITEAAVDVVDFCYRSGGNNAVRDGTPLQRRFRDIHTFTQHAATAEGWFGPAGTALLGLPTGFAN